jgi:threonine synthase
MYAESFLRNLICSVCAKAYPADQIQTYCPNCAAPLLPEYDLPAIKKSLDRDEIYHRQKGMWRWFELLPVRDRHNIITLGEGDTPLLRLDHLGIDLGLSNLFMKEECQNPTGSFKARGLAAAVSKARELGITRLVIPSAGNAGGAMAAYAARAEMDALIYMPKNTPSSNILESRIMGACIELVDGLIDMAGKYAQQMEASEGWFNLSTFREPYRVEGKKIMGYEIAESFGWKLPDVIIYPTGGGTGLVGMWKAFSELKALGWLESETLPRMISVQAQSCAPVVKAIELGFTRCEVWQDAHTIATGLCVPKSFADQLILKDIRQSNGTAISVSDDDILHWQSQLAKKEGIFACPEGAATLAGLITLTEQGIIHPDESTVLFNTGSGLKYICP